MPKHPKPWYRKARRRWFVQIDGQQVNLGPNKKAAFARYHALMQQPKSAPVVDGESLLAVIDAYLEWCQSNRAARTYEWYQERLQSFASFVPAELTISEFKPFHLQQWLDCQTQWASGSKRNGASAVQRAMNWAEQQGLIDRSPVAKFEKPEHGKRDTVISEEELQRILALVPDREFQDLILTAWHTGARPQEILAVEARHVDLENRRWVFPPKESKGKKLPRIVYLNEEALAVTKRLLVRSASGELYRNSRGRAWTTAAVNCAFIRVQIRIGKQLMSEQGVEIAASEIAKFQSSLCTTRTVKGTTVDKSAAELRQEAKRKLTIRAATKLAPKYCLYVFRHSWATRALQNGVDPLTVAILMGHSDPSMLAKTYQHLAVNPDYLQSAMKRATA